MTNKEQLLRDVRQAAREQAVTKRELTTAFDEGVHTAGRQSMLSKILYAVGGAVVFLGIVILVEQHWQTLSDVTRVLVTLGSGVALYVAAVLVSRKSAFVGVANAFHLISALLLPLGLFVLLDTLGVNIAEGWQSVVFGILFLMYLVSLFVYRRTVFVLFSVIFGTILFFTITNYFLVSAVLPIDDLTRFAEYRILLAGLSLVFIGHALRTGIHRALTGWFYGVGIVAFLGAGLALGGYNPDQNAFWEIIYPGLVFAVLFLSIDVKSMAFLVFGAIFLFAYIAKITSEYFADSLGWPFALVLVGFALIGVGYLTVYLRQKYFKDEGV